MTTIIVKKDGRETVWDENKIRKALMAASGRETENPITEEQIIQVSNAVEEKISLLDVVSTKNLHELVMQSLYKVNHEVYLQYKGYREFRKSQYQAFEKTNDLAQKIIKDGDKENANKDSMLNSTKSNMIGEAAAGELFKHFEMKKEWLEAHEEGWIYIHDLSSRFVPQDNCRLFDMANLLDGGFWLNGIYYNEPKHIRTAFAVVGDVTLSSSSQQFGGYSISEIDKVLEKYAEKTYDSIYAEKTKDIPGILNLINIKDLDEYEYLFKIMKEKAKETAEKETIRQIEQGYQGFETKLNTINSALGQTPFVTISFGLATGYWAKKIVEIILNTRIEGLGQTKQTAIFPKLSFLHRNEINGTPDSPNYDLKLLAIECSRERLYPDWLSLDSGNLADIYNRTGKAVTGMGCRSYLSEFVNPQTGEEVYVGRSNIGVITLGLIKMAIESKKDISKFYSLMEKYSKMAFEIHEWTYARLGKAKGSVNPLTFCEGGSWMSVGYDEPIAPILEGSTASLGYLGLEEVCHSLFGSGIYENHLAGLKIVKYLSDLCEEEKAKTGHLYSVYGTPAEGLVHKTQLKNRGQYGLIKNVTDKDYCTNSFHIPVWENISVPHKINMEEEFHSISTGGRISYSEFPYAVDSNVLRQAIDYAMSKGLYYGVNVVASTCNECHHRGDFTECPLCESENITSVVRCCGYLSYVVIKGDTRFNEGKQEEIKDRVKHI